MKKVIILALLMSGCSIPKIFDIQHAERGNCDGVVTPWANEVEFAVGRMSWRINLTGWHSKEIQPSKMCEIEPADMERWDKCTGEQHKCKLYPKKKPEINQPKIESIEPPEKGIIASL